MLGTDLKRTAQFSWLPIHNARHLFTGTYTYTRGDRKVTEIIVFYREDPL